MHQGKQNCDHCRGNECIYFYTTYHGQEKECRPPVESLHPTQERVNYYLLLGGILSNILNGADLELVGSVSRGRATRFSDIDLVVDSKDVELINQVEQELKKRSKFRFHLWPKQQILR